MPFPGFLSHSDGIFTDCPNHFPFHFFTKNIFIMKNLTDFRKTVETGMDPRLKGNTIFFHAVDRCRS